MEYRYTRPLAFAGLLASGFALASMLPGYITQSKLEHKFNSLVPQETAFLETSDQPNRLLYGKKAGVSQPIYTTGVNDCVVLTLYYPTEFENTFIVMSHDNPVNTYDKPPLERRRLIEEIGRAKVDELFADMISLHSGFYSKFRNPEQAEKEVDKRRLRAFIVGGLASYADAMEQRARELQIECAVYKDETGNNESYENPKTVLATLDGRVLIKENKKGKIKEVK